MPGPIRLLRLIAAALIGYVLGTAPSADVAARLATGGLTDIRRTGSGNPGGANAMVVLGRRWGLGVMAADVAKGAVACAGGRRVAGDLGAHLAGTAAVVGHCHPAWNGFRGGKGVATSVGQVLTTFPVYFPLDAAVAAAVHSLPGWRNRAFAAVGASSAVWVAVATLWVRRGWPNAWGPHPSAALPLAAATSSVVMLRRFAQEERRAQATVDVVEGMAP